jgi:hypothetical protein
MTLFRFVRRLLFCTVIGLIAFGLSGWLLRPQPRWTVVLPSEHAYHEFPERWTPGLNGEAIWVKASEHDENFEDLTRFLAFDPVTGKQLCAWRRPTDWREYPDVYDGRLTMMNPAAENPDGTGTQFWIADAKAEGEPILRTFAGEWKLSDDGLHAWRIDTTDDETLFLERRDLFTGKEWPTVRFPGRYLNLGERNVDYSSTVRRVAVARSVRLDGPSPAVDLFDADAGRLLDTLGPPPDDEEPATYVSLNGWTRTLDFRTGISPHERLWTYSLDERTLVTSTSPTPPDGAKLAYGITIGDIDGDARSWAALRIDPKQAWVAYVRSERDAVEWRRVPFSIEVDYYVHHHHGSSVNQLIGAEAQIVPGKAQLLVETVEPSLASAVPESLRGFAPAAWRTDGRESRFRWHDWDGGGWRNVGSRNSYTHQLRQRELITLTHGNDEQTCLLQSWPLPPRDPRPPAAVLGLLAAGGVWWACVRRARMRSAGRSAPPNERNTNPNRPDA